MKAKLLHATKYFIYGATLIFLTYFASNFLVSLALPLLVRFNWSNEYDINFNYWSLVLYTGAQLIAGCLFYLMEAKIFWKPIHVEYKKHKRFWTKYLLIATFVGFVPFQLLSLYCWISASNVVQKLPTVLAQHTLIENKWYDSERAGHFPCAEGVRWLDGLPQPKLVLESVFMKHEAVVLYRNKCIDDNQLFATTDRIDRQAHLLRDRFGLLFPQGKRHQALSVFTKRDWCIAQGQRSGEQTYEIVTRCTKIPMSDSKATQKDL